MKKLLLVVALFFICAKSYSIIFWQPYPIVVTTTGVAGHQRVECSVFDSLLGSWQYYYTPYYNDTIDITQGSSTVAVFYTAKLPFTNWNNKDTCYGYIIYDQEIHQFKPVLNSYNGYSDDYYFYYGVHAYSNQFYTYGECCYDQNTFLSIRWDRSTIYDILTHSWHTASGGPGDGGTCGGYDYHPHFEDILYYNIYDPVQQSHEGVWRGHLGLGSGGGEDLIAFYPDGWSTGTPDDTKAQFSAFDPYTHSWHSIYNDNALNHFSDIVQDQILLTCDDTSHLNYIAIYDDSLHQWAVRTDYHAISNAIIKDRVVAFADTSIYPAIVLYQVFSPTLRAWVCDSSQTIGLDTLFIDEGTVTWIDSSGATHFAGYIDSLGWGNYTTPLQLNYHLTDFYQSNGYPLFYVRDYTIGSDNTWFDFGDGIRTPPGAQHSLWHALKINGHYPASGADYNVCIYANTSAGLQGWCGTRSQPCSMSFSHGNGCAGNCQGQLFATPLTGNAPFSFSWSNGDSTSIIDSLCFGNYNVTVTDGSGCTVTHQFSFDTLQLSKTVTLVSCYGLCDGEAAVLPYGGTQPYTYTWSNGATTSAISGQCNGTISVTVQDTNQCSVTESYTITQPAVLNPQNVIYSQPSCWDTLHGEIDISYNGGTGPYSVSYVPAIGIISSDQNSFYIVNLPGGIYTVIVSDANGCTVTFVDTLITPVPITSFNVTGISPTCFGSCDGSFIPNLVGGTPPFEFEECSAGLLVPGSLCARNYCIEVRDVSYCYATDSFTVFSPPQIIAINSSQDPSCGGCTDGFIALNISGGTGPHTIIWNPNNGYLSGDTLHQLPAGIYTITILDSNLCELILTDTLLDAFSSIAAFGENDENAIFIFPNPASSLLEVASMQYEIQTVEIYNLLGEKVMSVQVQNGSKNLKPNQTIINVSSLPPSVYFVKVQTGKGSTVQRLIVSGK